MLPWKGSVTSDSLSKESGQRRGGGSSQGRGQGWSRMSPPGLEDGLPGKFDLKCQPGGLANLCRGGPKSQRGC